MNSTVWVEHEEEDRLILGGQTSSFRFFLNSILAEYLGWSIAMSEISAFENIFTRNTNYLIEIRWHTSFVITKNKVAIESSCVDPLTDTIIVSKELQQTLLKSQMRLKEHGIVAHPYVCIGAPYYKKRIRTALGKLAQQDGYPIWPPMEQASFMMGICIFRQSSEDVRTNVQEGKFGTWQETGLHTFRIGYWGVWRLDMENQLELWLSIMDWKSNSFRSSKNC
jgi:hypothetical protein